MRYALIPEPQSLVLHKGSLRLPRRATVGIRSAELFNVARTARTFLGNASIAIALDDVQDTLKLSVNPALRPGGYQLEIHAAGITLAGKTPAATAHGVQTLRQLVTQCGNSLPCMVIDDWPDFEDRGVYYDVCRGRVPTLERLKELADKLACYKINQLQLYIEHTFAFRRHPKIGKNASPLSAEDILELDAFCAERGIELVPSLATFGHMATVLKHREYHHLAEDGGIGRYAAPQNEIPANTRGRKAWSLSPAVPEVYTFLDSLFAEFLPLFSSERCNICCDETWDLGLGASYAMCRKKGRGVVYLEHVNKVRELCAKYGKKIMFWGDIIRHYPELIANIPSDTTVLDWGYAHDWPFARISDFKDAGLPFYACPGTSAWRALFPRIPAATANIHGFAAAGSANGAKGLLNTDWGDGGHHNFMEFSWHGYLFGAEQAWNTRAERATYTQRFTRAFLNSDSRPLTNAIDELGRISHLGGPLYQSLWYHALFAAPGDAVLQYSEPVALSEAIGDSIRTTHKPFDAKLAAAYLKRILRVREVLHSHASLKGADPLRILPYWVFAADTIICAARKVTVLGPNGNDTAANRRLLARELRGLRKRFEKLWMARNRRSEIRIVLKRYDHAIQSLTP